MPGHERLLSGNRRALRLNQAIYGDRTRDVITRLWDRVQEQLETQQAHLIGWYHTHPRSR